MSLLKGRTKDFDGVVFFALNCPLIPFPFILLDHTNHTLCQATPIMVKTKALGKSSDFMLYVEISSRMMWSLGALIERDDKGF